MSYIDCHARNDGVISPSLAELQTSCPPSLAEGARGWVSLDSTSKTSLHDSKADSSKADIAKAKSSVVSFANADSNNANFASAKSTHPLTPSAREGEQKKKSSAKGGGGGKAKSSAKESGTKRKIHLALREGVWGWVFL
ncbi:hypothetical protein [Helicobacter sp. T3_23-1059]